MNKRRRFKAKRAQSRRREAREVVARIKYYTRRGYQVITQDELTDMYRRFKEAR